MAQQSTHCSNSRLGRRNSLSRSLGENSNDPVYATKVIRDNPAKFLRLETLESQTTRPFLSSMRLEAKVFDPRDPNRLLCCDFRFTFVNRRGLGLRTLPRRHRPQRAGTKSLASSSAPRVYERLPASPPN